MRRGRGVSFGAISVVNAIPCGIGSAIGINLRTEVLFEESDETDIFLANRPELSDELARTCVKRTLERLGKNVPNYRLTVMSQIPASVGLKSSSSVCNAIVSAVLDACDETWDDIEILKMGVECARECGVTVTGSFDDACACMFGGFVVTNNATDEILIRKKITKYDVVIRIPDGEKKKIVVEEFKKHSKEFGDIAASASKDPFGALKKNGELMAKMLGVENPQTLPGVLAVGISGTGPAITYVTEHGMGKKIAEQIGGKTIVAETRNNLSFRGSKVNGFINAPPSKSYTHRAIIISALAEGKSRLIDPLISRDTMSTVEAVEAFGAKVVRTRDGLEIEGGNLHPPSKTIDAGNSGSTMRFMMGVSSLFDSEITLDGDESLRNRTVAPLMDSLRQGGVECRSENGKPPVTVKGPFKGGNITVDVTNSSQFMSSLMMVAPLVKGCVNLKTVGDLVSREYLEITAKVMSDFGNEIKYKGKECNIDHGRYSPREYSIPGDMSSAAYPLVAGALAGDVTVRCIYNDEPQGDMVITHILRRAGCATVTDGCSISCSKSEINAIETDVCHHPDLFPILAVLLSTAKGTSRLYGAPHLRSKESDRIASTVRMLSTLGADIEETVDGCIINGVESLHGGRIEHCGDHRVMMAAAVASLVCKGPVTMDDDGIWEISYPKFVDDMRSLGLKVDVLDR